MAEVLVKVYLEDGDYFTEYVTPVVPQKGEEIFIGDTYGVVNNVSHVVVDKDYFKRNKLTHVEIELVIYD